MKISKKASWILFSLIIILAAWLFQRNFYIVPRSNQDKENLQALMEIVEIVEHTYVDKVKLEPAIEGAINGFLSELDPHSVYFSEEEVRINEENFSGKYQGIGIEFDIIDDTITVIAPIPDSPSDKLGLMSGDKIIMIDGKSSVGITTPEVQNRLKGEKGTTVVVSVIREEVTDPMEFKITRDEIPLYTVSTHFMDKDKTGFILLNRFARTTDEEIEQALFELERMGMNKLILDLRWNAGGFLRQAVMLASKFIEGHKKIVYTKGRYSKFNEEYYSDSFGSRTVRDYPLIILINSASASASEIVAGAIQDYDRGLIVGTPSFGKGLVQREFSLDNDGRLRLTVSKYFTPSGRLIQRPYIGKDTEEYYASIFDTTLKSTYQDSLDTAKVFFTENGRKVYGGGGIYPDVIVEYTRGTKSPKLIQQFFQKRIFFDTANQFINQHKRLNEDLDSFVNDFIVDKQLLREMRKIARNKNIEIKDNEFFRDVEYIKTRLKAEIARGIWDSKAFYRVLIMDDNQYQQALELFNEMDEILVVK